MFETGCKFGAECSFPHWKVEGQPTKMPKKDGDKSAVAFLKDVTTIGLRISGHRAAGIFIDLTEQHKSLWTNSTSTIHKRFAASSKHSRQRSTVARKDTSQTSSLAQSVRRDLWGQISGRDRKTGAMLPRNDWSVWAPCTKTEEREFVVDPGASMHVVSKRGLNSAELETMRISRNPTTVMTANGEVQTREEATVYVKELDLFVTVMLLENTPPLLSLGKLCEDHRYNNHWISDEKPHLIKKGKRIDCNFSNYVPFVVPGLQASSSSTTSTPTSASSSSQDFIPDNRYTENPVTERSGSTSEELRVKPAAWIKRNQTQKLKSKTRRSTERYITWIAGLAAGIQREFGRWT